MLRLRKTALLLLFIFLLSTISAPNLSAKDKEYEAIVKHLQNNYQAKKVKIPFMWLARFAVRIVKPAGVRSFSFTMLENLKFSSENLDEDLKLGLRESLSEDWIPIIRIRSKNGEQVYAYMRDAGKDVKIMLVTINRDEAAVIRATFNPDKLVEFMENPKIFGIDLGDSKRSPDKSTVSN